MITAALRPLMPNLVLVNLAGACPCIGEVVTPGVYFLLFLLFDILAHLHRSYLAQKMCFCEFYTDTDTGLYNFFVLKMQFCAGYTCVQVICVCGVYAWKYGIGLKLQACVATVLTVETGKRTTGLLVSAPILK